MKALGHYSLVSTVSMIIIKVKFVQYKVNHFKVYSSVMYTTFIILCLYLFFQFYFLPIVESPTSPRWRIVKYLYSLNKHLWRKFFQERCWAKFYCGL